MRSFLDYLYRGCAVLAALLLVTICILTLLGVVSRNSGVAIPGLTSYAGYCMAWSSFLALAYTYRERAHIRVLLLLNFLHGRKRRLVEIWCLSVGSFLAGYFSYYAIKMVYISYKINDISNGVDATPTWVPQIGMAIGGTVFTVALVHRLIELIRGADLSFEIEQDSL